MPAGVARAVCVPLESRVDPALAARWLRGEPRAVALSGAWAGGGVLLSSHPLRVADADADPFAMLDVIPVTIEPGQPSDRRPAVGGGWLGWWGFELARRLERLPPAPPRPRPLPEFDLAFHDHVVRCDQNGGWWFEALWTEPRDALLRERLECWRGRLTMPPPDAEEFAHGPLRVGPPGTLGHLAAVTETVGRIAEGELSQANICLRLEGDWHGDLLDLWVQANQALAPAYGAFVAGENHAVASLSPELFLRRSGRQVETQPIKGTAPVQTDPARLAASEKDRAENVMIVDLMRNDLGRVCEYASVSVPALCAVKRAATVWHLVSTVTGRLREDVDDEQLLRATFPPGSVSGAPKIEALRVIHQLEPTARETYCGAIGIRSPLSGLELSVAIRTVEASEDRLWLGAGGGIVSDSVPADELREALAKAQGIADAAGVRIDAGLPPGTPSPAGPIVRLARPDPAEGVFETLLATAGAPVRLERHLARLSDACRYLGIAAGEDLEAIIRQTACELDDAALRVTVTATGVTVSTRPTPPAGATVLHPVVLPGGLGPSKWADRTLIDALSTPGSTPLLCDLDGTVLEAGYAAVLLVVGDELIAAPLDGRILDSISRRELLDAAGPVGLRVVVRGFSLDEALTADAVLLSSSLRGPHAGLLDGGPAADAATAVCRRLRDHLASAD
jgi:para-aminobenzoate synthetase/4-amino-4-deoxychorismate lyase